MHGHHVLEVPSRVQADEVDVAADVNEHGKLIWQLCARFPSGQRGGACEGLDFLDLIALNIVELD